jgi:hypothetical protein
MGTMSKTLLAVLVGILVGGAAYVMAAPADKSSSTATPAAATTRGPAPANECLIRSRHRQADGPVMTV